MSSGELFVKDDALHVFRDRHEHWWAVGRPEGSYGGSARRETAIKIAMDASKTGFHGQRPIVVHYIGGGIAYVVTRVAGAPTPQFFQDAVP